MSVCIIISLSACDDIQNADKISVSPPVIETQKPTETTGHATEKSQVVQGNNLKAHFFDVGRGDSEFIEFPNGLTAKQCLSMPEIKVTAVILQATISTCI